MAIWVKGRTFDGKTIVIELPDISLNEVSRRRLIEIIRVLMPEVEGLRIVYNKPKADYYHKEDIIYYRLNHIKEVLEDSFKKGYWIGV